MFHKLKWSKNYFHKRNHYISSSKTTVKCLCSRSRMSRNSASCTTETLKPSRGVCVVELMNWEGLGLNHPSPSNSVSSRLRMGLNTRGAYSCSMGLQLTIKEIQFSAKCTIQSLLPLVKFKANNFLHVSVNRLSRMII